MKLKTKVLAEISVKNGLVLVILFWLFVPWVRDSQKEMPIQIQGSVLGILGFLMAAAIIGAFELSYSKTIIKVTYIRYLAHITKFFLYLGISLLVIVGLGTMGITPGFFNDPIAFAAILIYLSLFLYDYWDAVRTLETLDV